MPGEVAAFVLHRDHHTCQASAFGFGSTEPCTGLLQIHHRLPRGRGGTHDPDLLVVLCLGHHAEVESYRTRAYACGLLLRTRPQTHV
jgi:hypothetical protein